MGEYSLVIRGLKKYFGHVKANDGIDLMVKTGTIHALVGENGAGKTTLVKCLFGLHQPDAGEIYLWGERLHVASPQEALARGIGMVHQHFMLAESLTALENIILGAEPGKGIGLAYGDSKKRLQELCARYGLEIDLDATVSDLPVGLQQRLEIIKVLYRGARLIILDEPTAVLTPQETERLFTILRDFKRDGRTVIFITHKLAEVMAVADEVTVIRDGKTAGSWPVEQVNEKQLARAMVGREVKLEVEKEKGRPGHPVLEITGLRVGSVNGDQSIQDISFTIRAGEIFGVIGVAGNGQDALVEGILGLRPVTAGEIKFLGERVTNYPTSLLRNKGLCCIPGDRLKEGLVREFSVWENAILGFQHAYPVKQGLFLSRQKIKTRAHQVVENFGVKIPDLEAPITHLSGGNQQKLIIGRELHSSPRLIIAVQPTRGVDIGAIEFIYQVLLERRRQGAGILLVSNELEEVLSLADRIGIIHRGRFMAVGEPGQFSREEIGLMMAGLPAGSRGGELVD
ncbi:Galactose/methyl galactoside import ATP-binding protein MglA [Neomoorella glycerini]|uniref:Galactose/methyl galactoside import ATP-binding protein MglA n=1 Tax=Neomoorella glycerini TaxID=55779 RepID=A0A6I5ZVP3_9FIRM|nr:ABC transporter ATP-binding protein [Moorella glycerini]QGP93638.1 Galactose/methyl galactoside import ATP-binding protein MglA [Moorella glycerini]